VTGAALAASRKACPAPVTVTCPHKTDGLK
jgi:hypothetical protein